MKGNTALISVLVVATIIFSSILFYEYYLADQYDGRVEEIHNSETNYSPGPSVYRELNLEIHIYATDTLIEDNPFSNTSEKALYNGGLTVPLNISYEWGRRHARSELVNYSYSYNEHYGALKPSYEGLERELFCDDGWNCSGYIYEDGQIYLEKDHDVGGTLIITFADNCTLEGKEEGIENETTTIIWQGRTNDTVLFIIIEGGKRTQLYSDRGLYRTFLELIDIHFEVGFDIAHE